MTKKKIIIGFFLCLFITTLLLHSLIFNINQPLGNVYTDAGQVNFILINNIKKIISFDFEHIFDLPEFYGYKNTLLYSNNFLLQSALATPIYLLTGNDPVVTFNIFITLSILFSIFTMYCFVLFMTGEILPSIFAALIFGFNPYRSGIFPDSLELFTLYLIPLIFLFFEKFLKEKKDKYILFVFIIFSLKLLSSFYYFLFLIFIFAFYALIRIKQEKFPINKFINNRSFFGIGIFITILIWILFTYHFKSPLKLSNKIFLITVKDNYSPFILNWFTTSPDNVLYGKVSEMIQGFAPAFFSTGHNDILNLFIGITPLIIFLLSFKFVRNSEFKKNWQLCLLIIAVSILFSFGPYIQITRHLSFPNFPYLLYRAIPWLTYIRVPARIAIFTFLFLSIVSALTLSEIHKKIIGKKFIIMLIVIICLTVIEYRVYPFKVPNFSKKTIDFYKYLESNKAINVILDYPIGNRLIGDFKQGRSETKDGRYLFLSLFHNKTLLNGYSSYLPDEYVETANNLSTDFPKIEQIKLLNDKGVDAIVLHKDEFVDPNQFSKIKNELLLLDINLIKSTEDLALFIL